MAKYNEILVGRYNRFLQKLLGIKGEPPAAQLAGEWMPAINYFTGVEERYLQGIERFGHRNQVASVAGQQGSLRIRNPAGSNVVAVLEKIGVFPAGADQPRLSVGTTPATPDLSSIDTITNAALDIRGRGTSTLVFSTQTTAAPPALNNTHVVWSTMQLAATNVVNEVIITDDQELTVLPNQCYQLDSQVAAQIIGWAVFWRERFLEEGERF